MPDSLPDVTVNCQIYERKLRALKRNILGIAAEGEKALINKGEVRKFKAKLAGARADWDQYQRVWDDRDSMQLQVVNQDSWPTSDWIADYDKIRDELFAADACLMQIDDELTGVNLSPKIENQLNLEDGASSPSRVISLIDHRLPAINIPHFHGDLLQWTNFKNTFISMVHDDKSIPNVKKFHYLKSTLKGNAATLIAHIPIGDESYTQAWDKMLKNYDNPRVLATLYVRRILDCDARSQKTELQRYEAFLDGVADGIEGFRSLDIPEKTDFLLSALALRALDPQTRNKLELSHKSSETAPTVDEVVEFVRKRANAIKLSRDFYPDVTHSSSLHNTYSSFQERRFPRRSSPKYNRVSLHAATSRLSTNPRRFNNSSFSNRPFNPQRRPAQSCPFCKGAHGLSKCPQFSGLSTDRRLSFVNGWKGCRNCLSGSHNVSECKSIWNCRTCNKRHHTLIHPETPGIDETPSTVEKPGAEVFAGFGTVPQVKPAVLDMVLLATVQCLIEDRDDCFHPVRAVIDSGSQQTFISSPMAFKLGLPLRAYEGTVSGLGGATALSPAGVISCALKPFRGSEEIRSEAVVINRISPQLPSATLSNAVLRKLAHFDLADRSFGTPGVVDLLIGADIFTSIITGAPKRSPISNLFLLPTIFGLAVIGKIDQKSDANIALFTLTAGTIEKQLKLFWELEEPAEVDRSHPDDRRCEDHFIGTHTRNDEGRYILRLPFKSTATPICQNRALVIKRFLSLERRFASEPCLKRQYVDFMKEYRGLGHMSVATAPSNYLIPHHGVQQGSKLRVVFDASFATSAGISLNEALHSGPKLQKDICLVLTRFRMYAVPLCADLVKMYRQVLIHPEDRSFQHIIWRENPGDDLVEWELNTVTYGVRSSSYQALRVIKQLIADEGQNFPLAADRAAKDMFVDDIVSGADTLEEARILKEQLSGFFSKGGFNLSKWASTEPSLIPEEQDSMEPVRIRLDDDSTGNSVKILGLVWDPKSDCFSYDIRTPNHFLLTKRLILSSVARIFDPLGFLSPVILLAKILLQDTWKKNLAWDEPLPPLLVESWSEVFNEWALLSTVTIPRQITSANSCPILVGFCDASTKGYAAALYLRSANPGGLTRVSLVKAKTKVAPTKFTSIARLELCAALLLSRLVSSITIDGVTATGLRCFTDSSNVLSWLNMPIHQLKVFEANRVSQILDATPLEAWGHVRSAENPCDIGSRGCTPRKINECRLWWRGPHWLVEPVETWPQKTIQDPSSISLLANQERDVDQPLDDWTTRFSSLELLIRSVSRILRFREVAKPLHQPISRPLTAEDINNAKTRLIMMTQRVHLPSAIFTSRSTPAEFQQLSPFLDERGIVRVGGRLQNAPLNYSAKHPILIPANSHLSSLLIRDIHEKNFHAGSSLVLALLRNSYWIPKAGKEIRKCILSCIQCRKLKAKPVAPLMSPLPKDRFAQHRPFIRVGVDFAGPFSIKESTRRNASLGKAYLCVFVCLATKALHLEAATSLSTAAFLASFDRFTSRRGLPNVVWSDNGTNFVGASCFIKDIYAFLAIEERTLTERIASIGVEWKFIPPRAPHFGGIWEAGVKSVKSLLISTVGKQPYTYEELTTAFTRIEGLLNSRPLCSLSEDVRNFDYLTPGHFLIGTPISSLPEPSDPCVTGSAATRWDTMKRQIANIWERWRKEYLHNLQQKKKWFKNVPNIEVGDLVFLLERRFMVGKWPVARVIETHTGSDGVARAVVVKTPSGSTFVRAVTSLVPLFFVSPEKDSGDNNSQRM